jgi:hypothetical protein
MTKHKDAVFCTTPRGNAYSIRLESIPAEDRGRNHYGAYVTVRITHPGAGYRRDISFTADEGATLESVRTRADAIVDDSYATPLR